MFNLIFVVILIIGLFETMVVHRLITTRKQKLALGIDRIARLGISIGVFPLSMLGMLLAANSYSLVGILVASVGIFAVIAATWHKIYADLRSEKRFQDRVRAQLASCSPDDTERYHALLEQAFALFDDDGSGEMDSRELRTALLLCFPSETKSSIYAVEAALREQGVLMHGQSMSSKVRRRPGRRHARRRGRRRADTFTAAGRRRTLSMRSMRCARGCATAWGRVRTSGACRPTSRRCATSSA